MSYIGLIDCNNFFVSCERLFRPDLKGRPTIVLSSNDGCVVARSQEVKDLGIPMGIPYFQIKDELEKHQVAIFSGNLTLYRDISARVMHTLRDEVGEVEQYSVDEAFFKFDMPAQAVPQYLQELKHHIETSIGIPVSIGAAKTKTIAKYASEHEKRGVGYCFLTGEAWQKLTPEIPVSAIWGVGGKTSQKLSSFNVTTVADFLALDRSRIDKIFGVAGLRLQSELSEIRAERVQTDSAQKSFMSTRSFEKETESLQKLESAITYHMNHVAADLREQELEAQVVRVMARTSRHGDWALQGGSLECLLPAPTNDTRVLLKHAIALLHALYQRGVPYKKAGVVVSHISSEAGRTTSLFTDPADTEDRPKIMSIIDTLNKKLGKGTVTVGSYEAGTGLTKSSWRSPHYTTKWSDIPTIQT